MRDAGAGERWNRVVPPKVMLTIEGLDAKAPAAAIRIAVPAR
jgi:hypothetical protein